MDEDYKDVVEEKREKRKGNAEKKVLLWKSMVRWKRMNQRR